MGVAAGTTLGQGMLNIENFKNARWQDIYAFFVAGSPPLMVKLLIINTIFLVILIIKKSRGGNRNYQTSYTVQALLIAANCLIMFQSQLLPQGQFLDKLNKSRELTHEIYKRFTG